MFEIFFVGLWVELFWTSGPVNLYISETSSDGIRSKGRDEAECDVRVVRSSGKVGTDFIQNLLVACRWLLRYLSKVGTN